MSDLGLLYKPRPRRASVVGQKQLKMTWRHALIYDADFLLEAKRARRAAAEPAKYPRALIRWFASGLIVFVLGFCAFIIGAVAGLKLLNYTAVALLVFGSGTVAITLLRGQDLDERPH